VHGRCAGRASCGQGGRRKKQGAAPNIRHSRGRLACCGGGETRGACRTARPRPFCAAMAGQIFGEQNKQVGGGRASFELKKTCAIAEKGPHKFTPRLAILNPELWPSNVAHLHVDMIVPRVALPPASLPASWPTPNYNNPVTRGPALLVVNSVFLGLSSIFVLLRIHVRCFVVKKFSWDDLFICIGLVSPPLPGGFQLTGQLLTIGLNICVDLGGLKYGWNRHTYDIPLAWLPRTSAPWSKKLLTAVQLPSSWRILRRYSPQCLHSP
jgi:hypothetical protein